MFKKIDKIKKISKPITYEKKYLLNKFYKKKRIDFKNTFLKQNIIKILIIIIRNIIFIIHVKNHYHIIVIKIILIIKFLKIQKILMPLNLKNKILFKILI